jgi:anti-anti-sigma regulatory factor/anti-sigma regulatory factor (Ser/Thr protein kinase)
MATTVQIPNSFDSAAIFSFSQSVVRMDGYPIDNEIVFDFQNLRFVDGAGLTVLCNALEWLLSHNVKISARSFQPATRASIAYLDDCRFFEKYLGAALRPTASVRETTIPFESVSHAAAHSWLEQRFTPWMASTLQVSNGALGSLRAAIKEIFHNIHDHTALTKGHIHVQHYPKPKQVGITVADFGKGIPNNVRLQDSSQNDAEAIVLATQAGFTTKSKPNNMGAGLDFLVRNITSNKGWIGIYSFRGRVICTGLPNSEISRVSYLGQAAYPGTLIDIRLPIDKFTGDDEEEGDMSW